MRRSWKTRSPQSAAELEMLIEIVSNLKIDDATQRTAIIDNISAIFAEREHGPGGARNARSRNCCRSKAWPSSIRR